MLNGLVAEIAANLPGLLFRRQLGAPPFFIPASDRFFPITGYHEDELLSKDKPGFDSCIIEADRPVVGRALWLAAETGKYCVEYRFRRKDGVLRTFCEQGSPLKGNDGHVRRVDGILFDITDMEFAQVLAEQRKAEAIATMAGGVAHDFNNLLMVILGRIALAKEESEPSLIYAQLEEAEEAVKQAADLTSRFILFAGSAPSCRAPCSVSEILAEVLCRLKDKSKKLAELEIFVKGDDGVIEKEIISSHEIGSYFPRFTRDFSVCIDKSAMTEALYQVIDNAFWVSGPSGRVSVFYESACWPLAANSRALGYLGRYVRIFVKDTGPGIPREHFSRIFDPYFSTQPRGSRKGMGLGLALAHAVICRNGGRLSFESEPGQGTCAIIELPESVMQEQRKESGHDISFTESERFCRGKKILVVDEEQLVRDLVLLMGDRVGAYVDTAHQGKSAISKVEQALKENRPYDLVILDFTVKEDMVTKDVVKIITELDPGIPLVAASSYPADPVIISPGKYGFVSAIGKPYNYYSFVDTVARYARSGNQSA